MNKQRIVKILGLILVILGVSMIPPLCASWFYGESAVARAFLLCLVPLIGGGAAIIWCAQARQTRVGGLVLRESYLIVTLCWLAASFFGAFPYLLSGAASSFIDAFFDSVASFTTTGCSVLALETLPKGLLLWKSVSQFLGGMGILVFAISLLPMLGIGGQQIVKAESAGPTLNKVTARISDSAKRLYLTYIAFAALEFALLLPALPFYDALIYTFGSVSTSGLNEHLGGLAAYDSVYAEAVVSLFTILASINFALYARPFQRKGRELLGDAELRAFFCLLLSAVCAVSVALYGSGTLPSLFEAFRVGAFQVIAFSTTSGYIISDFTLWPTFCKLVLFALLFVGGCAASTCGSVKVVRVLVLLKLLRRGFQTKIHPNSVVTIKLGDKPVPEKTVEAIAAFACAYLAVFLFSALVLSLQNPDVATTVSTAASLLSNTGCAFGPAGAASDYSLFAPPLRLFLSFLMITGRLEIFTVLLLLSPGFWSSN